MYAPLCLALLVVGHGDAPAPRSVGTLWQPGNDGYRNCRAYHPQEGDLIFFSFSSALYALGYALAGSGHPWHVGMVVRRADGELGILEVGAVVHCVTTLPVEPRLRSYLDEHDRRRIWIRTIARPLSPLETQQLKEFVEAQVGKGFATRMRLTLLGLPSRPLRPTSVEQCRWFCAELAAEAIRSAGLCPPDWVCPEKTVPSDLFDDSVDLRFRWNRPRTWSPDDDPPPLGPPLAPP